VGIDYVMATKTRPFPKSQDRDIHKLKMGEDTLGALVRLASQFVPECAETIASSASNRRLIATIPVTKHIHTYKDKFDPAGYSQLLENSVDVIPYGMFLYFELLSDFAVLQAVGDEANHISLATRRPGNSAEMV